MLCMLILQVLETLRIRALAYDASDTENDNIAIGHGAMSENTAGGTKNIAIGVYAADALTSGDDNTGLGYAALGALNTGSANVALVTMPWMHTHLVTIIPQLVMVL